MLSQLRNQALSLISNAKDPEELEQIRVSYLGKKGKLNRALKELLKTTPNKKLLGHTFNQTKQLLQTAISKKTSQLKLNIKASQPQADWLDATFPGHQPPLGHLHPISQTIHELNQFFKSLGFSIVDGPEIETDEFNFQRLNLPPDHPARDLQDTLYITPPNLLLRTHTSSIEARILAQYSPPLRVVVPGKVYRYEAVNPSNNVMFFHYQGFAIDRQITMANLKWVLEKFVRHFYGPTIKTRFRCKYYPEVEPTAGMDLACTFCNQKGCPVCKYRGWLEILGCGMIHPNILKMAKIDYQKWSGFAWGMGLDRLVMTKFKIADIRDLTNGSITYPYS